MSQTKKEFHTGQIRELVEKIREVQDRKGSGLFAAELDWIEFHAKELANECKDCAESHTEAPPVGSKRE